MHQWLQTTTVNWLKDREVLIEGNVIKLLDSYQCLSKIIILHFQFNFCSKNHILQLVSCDFRHNLYTTKYTKVIQITQFRTNWVGKLILFVNYPFVGKRGKHSQSKSLKNYRNMGQTSRYNLIFQICCLKFENATETFFKPSLQASFLIIFSFTNLIKFKDRANRT